MEVIEKTNNLRGEIEKKFRAITLNYPRIPFITPFKKYATKNGLEVVLKCCVGRYSCFLSVKADNEFDSMKILFEDFGVEQQSYILESLQHTVDLINDFLKQHGSLKTDFIDEVPPNKLLVDWGGSHYLIPKANINYYFSDEDDLIAYYLRQNNEVSTANRIVIDRFINEDKDFYY